MNSSFQQGENVTSSDHGLGTGDWGLGTRDWRLETGDWRLPAVCRSPRLHRDSQRRGEGACTLSLSAIEPITRVQTHDRFVSGRAALDAFGL